MHSNEEIDITPEQLRQIPQLVRDSVNAEFQKVLAPRPDELDDAEVCRFLREDFPRIVDARDRHPHPNEVALAMRRFRRTPRLNLTKEDSMGLLRSVHEDTTPVHPKDDPDVQAKGREVEAARTALSDDRAARPRAGSRARRAPDELHVLLTAQELAGLRGTGTLTPAWRSLRRSGATMRPFRKPEGRGSSRRWPPIARRPSPG